mgnify:CR=1 FL=1
MDLRATLSRTGLAFAAGLVLLLAPLACGGKSATGDTAGQVNRTFTISPATPSVTAGRTLQFTATPPWDGGVTWSVLPATAGTFSGTGLFTAGATPGAATVVATFTPDARYTASVPLTILPAPDATITAPTYASEHVAGLTATVRDQPGCTYAWTLSGNGTLTSGVATRTATFAVTNSGTVTLTAKVTNALGVEDTRTHTVTVLARPLILSFTTDTPVVVPGGTARLLPVFAGGTGVITPGTYTAVSGTPQPVTLNQTTTFTLTVTNASGHTATATVTVQVVTGLPPSTPTPGQIWDDPMTGIRLVFCPPGTYQMGAPQSDPLGKDDERPVHTVTFSRGFWISQNKVHQNQWQTAMAANPAFFLDRDSCTAFGTNGLRPVEQVAWEQVQAYLDVLNRGFGFAAYRLPSEAEWEYAYRAGTTTSTYWGGPVDDAPLKGWITGSAELLTRSVGTLGSNPWGLKDMVGNVMEWTADVYFPDYTAVPADGTPALAPFPVERAVRGSAWNDAPVYARATPRHAMGQDASYRTLGFRLVRPHEDAPKVKAFAASTSAPLPKGGGTVTLSWNVEGATRVWIDRGIGVVTGTSAPVTLTESTRFTLLAQGPGGWAMRTLLVEVTK